MYTTALLHKEAAEGEEGNKSNHFEVIMMLIALSLLLLPFNNFFFLKF